MNRFFLATLAVALIASQTVMAADKKVEAKKMLQAAEELELSQSAEGLSEAMAEWLGRHRLQSCATNIARIAGA